MNNNYPQQTISTAEKLAIKEGDVIPEFIKAVADYYTSNMSSFDEDRAEMGMLRDAVDGIIDKKLYEYVLNPYKVSDVKYLQRPAELRNYDFISTIYRSLVGERSDLPVDYSVVATNADIINEFKDALDKAIDKTLQKKFIKGVNEKGIDTGIPSEETDSLENLVATLRSKFDDEQAKDGQTILELIEYTVNLKDKIQDAWGDYVAVGEYVTYKEVLHDDVNYEVCMPEDIFVFDFDKQHNLIEDAGAVVRKSTTTINSVVDRWRGDLGEEDITRLTTISEQSISNGSVQYYNRVSTTPDAAHMALGDRQALSSFNTGDGNIDLFHIVWKTFKKVGVLQYINLLGQPDEMEVDENYKLDTLNGDISINWEYINEVWQVFKVGTEYDALYFDWGPIPVQRNDINNSSRCKLPYNGKIGYTRTRRRYSLMKQVLAYQLLYNVYHYRFEMLMAKNKDKLMMMPFGLIPKDWKMEKWMYYVEATGISWFDETNPKVAQALQYLKGVDLGLGNYIEQTRNLMESIKIEAYDSIGFNRQRLGDIKASEKKGNVDSALQRSSIMTAEISRKFDDGIEADLNGLVDNGKVAFRNGKKGRYINRLGEVQTVEIDALKIANSSYGVFVKNTIQEKEKVAAMKGYAFSLAQNDKNPAMIASIIDANSISKITDVMIKYDKIEKQYEKSISLEKEQLALQTQQLKGEADKLKIETTKYVADKSYQQGVDVALINADSKTLSDIQAGLNTPDIHAENKLLLEQEKSDIQSSLARRKQDFDESSKQLDNVNKRIELALKNKKIDNDLAIAKANKNKYD